MQAGITIILLIGFFLLFVKKPKLIPIVLTFMYLSGLQQFLPRISGISFSLILLALSLFVWFFLLCTRKYNLVFLNPQSYIILIFLMIVIINLWIGDGYTFADANLRTQIINLFYYFIIIGLVVSSRDIEKIISLIPWIIAFHVVFIFLPYGFLGESYGRHEHAGVFAAESILITNPNVVVRIFMFFLPIIYYFTRFGDTIRIRNLSKLLLYLSVAIIVLTISRSGFLMLSFFFLWMLRQHSGWQKKILAAATILMVISGAIGEVYKSRIMTLQEGMYAAKGRSYRWEVALKSIRDNPVFGLGPTGMDRDLYLQYASRSDDTFITRESHHGSIHNGFLIVAMNYGVPVFIFFMSIFYFTFKDLIALKKYFKEKKSKKYESLLNSFIMSLIMYLITMMFAHTVLDIKLLLLVGITMVMKEILREKKWTLQTGQLLSVNSV